MSTTSLNIEDIKWLREQTGAGVMEAKDALARAEGDRERAMRILEQTGRAHAEKKAGRATANGTVTSYIHHGAQIGVLVELDCETDFTGRSEQFRELAHHIALQIAAHAPRYTSEEEIPEAEKAEVMATLEEEARKNNAGKPEQVLQKIAEGQYRKWKEANLLLEQAFVRDQNKTIQQLINDLVLQVKENIVIRRWARFQVGV
ncbi:MAG TPA: elongation factor Ts [Chloroflexota bacterium]|nr:elongation factor Ts [Chloroflexota bacterium]